MKPTTTSPPHSRMNAYVGTVNSRPDSRRPRRLAKVTKMMRPMQMRTRLRSGWSARSPASDGNAAMMAATPDATDTATVIT